MKKKLFNAGETVFKQGDASEFAYRIIAGSVDIVVLSQNGNEKRVASLGPGEVFGEMGIISTSPRSATVTAREDTVCEVIPSELVVEILSTDPMQVIDLVRALILRLRTANRKLVAKPLLSPHKHPYGQRKTK